MSSPVFKLDPRLANDCIQLGYLSGQHSENKSAIATSLLLLMNNAVIPWFVIVPMDVTVIDIDELDEKHQQKILNEVNVLSAFLKKHYSVDKINFASIGNIVKQMHFHLVARNKNDPAWPGVVWGTTAKIKYNQQQVEVITKLLSEEIKFFKPI